MKGIDILRSSLKALQTHKLRSLLAMIGIIIGITSVIAIVALGEGSRIQVEDEFRELGTNVIQVSLYSVPNKTMDIDLLERIAENESIDMAAPVEYHFAIVRSDISKVNGSIKSTTHDYFVMEELSLAKGRLFTDFENENYKKVAVIGSRVALTLFGNTQCINKTFKVETDTYTVIGILEPKGSSWGEDLDNIIYIPFYSGQKTFKIKGINEFYVRAIDEDVVSLTETTIKSYLRNWIAPYSDVSQEQDISETDQYFSIYSDTVSIQALNDSMRTITALISGIGGISLLVGCIGIINIMLISIYERTKEIGIRKALGAKDGNILVQFLLEAVVLTLIGGIIGSLGGIGVSFIAGNMLDITPKVTMLVIFIAVSLSIFTGLISGIYPAIRASRMEPVEALRQQ